MYNRKINITESDRTSILNQYYQHEPSFFDNYLTIDGRFYIKDDNLYDLQEQQELGNLFSIKNLKVLFENVNIINSPLVDKVRKTLNEIVNEKLTIFEVKREILIGKTLLTEQEDMSEPETDQNTSQGSLIGNGVLWIARKLKSLLWSIGGMAVDAFLVASGIGKSVQWIPWAICLALDSYQWSSGDYGTDEDFKNSSTFWKILTIGFDIMGMMTGGVVAKGAEKLFAPIKMLKDEVKLGQWVAKSPQAKSLLTKMSSLLSGATGWLSKAAESITTKMPTMGKWLSSAVETVGKSIAWVGSFIGKILGTPGRIAGNIGTKLGGEAIGLGTKSATNTAALMGGFEKGGELYTQYKTGLSSIQLKNLETLSQI